MKGATPARRKTFRIRRLPVVVGIACLSSAGLAAGESSTAKGKIVFTQQAQPSCTVCHTLADAGSQGQIGPDLDALGPDAGRVYKAVTGGVGVMPPYSDSLSETQRRAVAAYVAEVTGGGAKPE